MYEDSQMESAENAPTAHMTLNIHHETNLPNYNIPPPNVYVSSYINYPENCSAILTSHHTNLLVPPYPPPNFQNNVFPQTNSGQVFIHNPNGDSARSFALEAQFNSIPEKGAFINIPSVDELSKLENVALTGSSWIESFLSKGCKQEAKKVPEKLMKISDAKECFKKCITLLQELEQLKENMHTNYKDTAAESWNFLSKDFLDKKNKFSDQYLKLPDPTILKEVLEKRYKKREGQRRRKKRKMEANIANIENRQVLHHKIDTWLKFMQETIDRNRREESLKKEADSVLSEVLKKKADGRRQLSLLEALVKLRQLRAKTAIDRGQHVSPESGVCFIKVAENLRALWDKQLIEYNLEEQGMRVMLNEAVDERDQSQVSRERHILSQWGKLLFGTRPCDFPEFYLIAEKNVDALFNIRHSWDKFAVSSKASVQSNIPIGWILPDNPSTSKWESLLPPEKIKT